MKWTSLEGPWPGDTLLKKTRQILNEKAEQVLLEQACHRYKNQKI